jgi:ketosteroid isomerase-like protein
MLSLVAIIVVVTLGCSPARSNPATIHATKATNPVDDAAEEVLSRFIEALNTCDLESTMVLFSEDATVFFPFPEHAERIEGKKNISAAFAEFYESVRSQKNGPRYMSIVPHNVEVQTAKNVAVVSFQIVSGPVTSRRTLVLAKAHGRWVIMHLHASNIRLESHG